jgi:hypothetical protein
LGWGQTGNTHQFNRLEWIRKAKSIHQWTGGSIKLCRDEVDESEKLGFFFDKELQIDRYTIARSFGILFTRFLRQVFSIGNRIQNNVTQGYF